MVMREYLFQHWKYLQYVVRHKWFVYQAGREIGVGRWQLLIHDWHKFLPSEWIPYAEFFNGPKTDDPAEKQRRKDAFRKAWLLHQNRAPHHWNFWVLVNDWDDPQVSGIEMPYKYILEMIADWRGAGKAQGNNDTRGWYLKNRSRQIMHENTRYTLEMLLHLFGYLEESDLLQKSIQEP